MYGGSDPSPEDSERTAFRKAEKKYKIYYDNTKKKKVARPVDLSEVVDFKSILEKYNCNGELMDGVSVVECNFDRPVFCLESRPGFYFIPGALSVEEQCQWIRESLTSFPQPPNRTNHNAIYGPIDDLFVSAKERKFLVLEERHRDSVCQQIDVTQNGKSTSQWKSIEGLDPSCGNDACKSVPGSVLLRKLRWSTLGLQFDWSKVLLKSSFCFLFDYFYRVCGHSCSLLDNLYWVEGHVNLNETSYMIIKIGLPALLFLNKRSYNVSVPHKKIPNALCQLAKRMAAHAMPRGEEFQPEAAIVNYFGLGDMLGGHLDDMEKDWSKPIVSMSLGCKAIFLLGGKSREDPPIALFLQSGDVVLMAGEARECFHGVPRIFTDAENAEISALESQFAGEDDLFYLNYIRTSRININIRQVF